LLAPLALRFARRRSAMRRIVQEVGRV
jgi:hypothetical protein